MKPLIVFLNGACGSGKSEIANYLQRKYKFSQHSFGDGIKKSLYALNPFLEGSIRLKDYVDVYGWDPIKRNYPEARRLLQFMGTEAGRDIHGVDCWTNKVLKEIEYIEDKRSCQSYVISDLRFKSEFLKFYESYLYTCRIVHVSKSEEDKSQQTSSHSSESLDVFKEFPQFVTKINNNGTFEDLFNVVDKTLLDLLFPRKPVYMWR